MNSVPTRSLDCTSIVPPCRAMMFFAMYNPRPVPSLEYVVAFFPRKNLIKIDFRSCSLIPIPESLIRIIAKSPSFSIFNSILPPSSEYLIALSIIFLIARPSLAGSK